MPPSYKELKESFVSGHTGSSIAEINVVTAVAPVAYLLWSTLQARHGLFAKYDVPVFLADFLLHVASLLLVFTVYSSIGILFNILLVSVAALAYMLRSKKQTVRKVAPPTKQDEKSGDLDAMPVRPFITAYRGGMMIATCLAILAVDFKIFPRRFAKVETWGTSLMDMGVGSFVFSAGIVSARPVLKAELSGQPASIGKQLKASVRTSLPLSILGIVRLYSVKKVDYAEHVTEYGIHWNFFFTLAFLPPIVALFQPLPTIVRCYVLPYLLMLGYELLLEYTWLKAYILTAPRTDLLSQNREGVFSFVGYLTLFMAGQGAGLLVLPRTPYSAEPSFTPRDKRIHLLKMLLAWHLVYYLSYVWSTNVKYGLGIHPSRRLANAPYVEWVLWFNLGQILFYCVIESLLFPGIHSATDKQMEDRKVEQATSKVLKALNRNGLAIFLLANLLTGFINLTMDTLRMGVGGSVVVLGAYAFLLTSVAVALDRWNISIKL